MNKKGTPNIFISALKGEMEIYREKASMVCLNEGLIPNIIKWEEQDMETMGAHAEHRVTQCDLFIGIYGNNYGEKNVIVPGSEGIKDSSIGIEFQSAWKHLGEASTKLYAKDLMSREPDLEKITTHGCKYVNDEIEFARDFSTYLSKWNDKRLGLERDSAPAENLRSIDIQCSDKEGLLATIFQALTTQGWDIIRAKQTLYQRDADIKAMVKWKKKAGGLPESEDIEKAIKGGITDCSNKKTSESATINIVQIKKEICEVVRERGRFIIQFYDDQGMAELLFTVFSSANVGILESELEAISEDRPKISRFDIVANLTNVEPSTKKDLADNIRDVSGVIHVEEKREIATWWY